MHGSLARQAAQFREENTLDLVGRTSQSLTQEYKSEKKFSLDAN